MKCIYFQVRLPRRRDLRQGGRHDILPGQLDAGVDADGDQHDGGVVVIAVPPSKQPQQQTKKMSVVSVQPSNKKTSVFERLGDSSVTSTTPEAPDSSAAAAAKVD